MRIEIIIISYCVIAICPLMARWILPIAEKWLWFINDMSYGIRVIVLALPVFMRINYRARDWMDYFILVLFGSLLLSNVVVILNDYEFIDIYDSIFAKPRLFVTAFLFVLSIWQLRRGK